MAARLGGEGLQARHLPLPPEGGQELDLLLACLRARFDPGAVDQVRRAAAAPVDASRLSETARRHRIGAIASRALRDAGVDEPWCDEIHSAAGVAAMRGLRLVSGLARALDLLAAARIRPIALKGPLMAAELYGDVGLRPSSDLDLLVAHDQLTEARHVLQDAGFRPDPLLEEEAAVRYLDDGFAYSFRDDARDIIVEIHPTLAHRAFDFSPDLEGVWRRARTVPAAGREVLTLSPEDRLLFLCVHGAKHEWDQLIWVCDVAEALRAPGEIDWHALERLAATTGSQRMLQLGLYLAHQFTGVRLPLEAAVLAAAPGLPTLALEVWDRMLRPVDRRPPLWRQLRFHLGVRERPAERWGQTREKVGDRIRSARQRMRLMVVPSETDRAFLELPPRLSALYYLVRPVRVLLGARRAAGTDKGPVERAG